MSYGMDGWNHDNDLVRRKDVMDSLVKEYNRRFSLGERSGLRLAWIEKAVNEVDVAQPEPIKINIDHELTKDEYEKIRKDLADAPIVLQPERKTGRWIYGEHDVAMCDGYWCDKCGFFVPWDYQHKFIDFIKDYHFCPNCGARMEVKA